MEAFMTEKYLGYKELELTDDEFSELYTNGRIGDYLFKEKYPTNY